MTQFVDPKISEAIQGFTVKASTSVVRSSLRLYPEQALYLGFMGGLFSQILADELFSAHAFGGKVYLEEVMNDRLTLLVAGPGLSANFWRLVIGLIDPELREKLEESFAGLSTRLPAEPGIEECLSDAGFPASMVQQVLDLDRFWHLHFELESEAFYRSGLLRGAILDVCKSFSKHNLAAAAANFTGGDRAS